VVVDACGVYVDVAKGLSGLRWETAVCGVARGHGSLQ
jgi:hypothetical protein